MYEFCNIYITEGGHSGGHGGHEGYQVFHVEFERVQLPFIISLWIFVSSLAKIGMRERPLADNIVGLDTPSMCGWQWHTTLRRKSY